MRDFRDAKAMAKALQAALATQDITINPRLGARTGRPAVRTCRLEQSCRQDRGGGDERRHRLRAGGADGQIFDVPKGARIHISLSWFTIDWEHTLWRGIFPLYTSGLARGPEAATDRNTTAMPHRRQHGGLMKGIRAFQKESDRQELSLYEGRASKTKAVGSK